jgi:hypothetical protein
VERGVSLLVTVNQGAPSRFCLDTGLSGAALVSGGLARKLKLVPTGSTTLGGPTGKGAIEVATTRIDSIAVGDSLFRGVEAAIQPDSAMLGDCEGVLGLSLFRDLLLTLDLPKGELRLSHGSLLGGARGVLPYTSPHGIPQVAMTVGARTLRADVDTMGPGLSLPAATMQTLKLRAPAVRIGRGRTLGGDFEVQGAVVDDTLQLGPYSFRGSFVEFTRTLQRPIWGSLRCVGFVSASTRQAASYSSKPRSQESRFLRPACVRFHGERATSWPPWRPRVERSCLRAGVRQGVEATAPPLARWHPVIRPARPVQRDRLVGAAPPAARASLRVAWKAAAGALTAPERCSPLPER